MKTSPVLRLNRLLITSIESERQPIGVGSVVVVVDVTIVVDIIEISRRIRTGRPQPPTSIKVSASLDFILKEILEPLFVGLLELLQDPGYIVHQSCYGFHVLV